MVLLLCFQLEKEVIAEGVASVVNVDKGVARDRALSDALRNAIEQAVGSYISSQTIIENYQLLQDNIFSKAQGYIKEYMIISEKEENGLYRIKIRAKVKEGELKDDLSAIKLLILEKGRPRVLILSNEDFLEDELTNRFRDNGFPVLDPQTLKKKMKKEALRLELSGANDTALSRMALREGAEMLVVAQYREELKNIKSAYISMDVKNITLTSRVIDPHSAEIIASHRIEKQFPNINPQLRSNLIDSLFRILKAQILENWQSPTSNVVRIHLYNAPFETYNNLRNFLMDNIRRVQKVIIKEYVGDYGMIEIITPENAQNIASILSSNFKKLSLKEIQGNDIHFEWKKN
jgi:hypothetical protein